MGLDLIELVKTSCVLVETLLSLPTETEQCSAGLGASSACSSCPWQRGQRAAQ